MHFQNVWNQLLLEKVDDNENQNTTTVAIFLEFLDFNLKTYLDRNFLSNS